jgi:YD repeat-containing protein
MSDRRTFLGNAAAAALMTKISSLRSFGFATDGPETIDTTMSDRGKAGLRGPVRTCIKEITYPTGKCLTTTEYSTDGRVLTTRTTQPDGPGWVTTHTYDADGRLTKTTSGNASGPDTETLYAYDEAGRLLSITEASKDRGSKTEFHYDEQGRKTAVQNFDARTFQRPQGAMYAGSPWDLAVGAGIGVSVGGHITTIYDGNQPTEAQIYDGDGCIVSRIVRSYDADGRIIEEREIEGNPPLILADKFGVEEEPQSTAAQLEAMNKAMKSMLSGRTGARISYAYDAQGRVVEIHDRNFVFDKVTTTSYNEHGDESALRETITVNSTVPIGVAFSEDENGTFTPINPAAEPTRFPEISGEVRYTYQYDSYGNWTEQTAHQSSTPEGSSSERRTLTYY